MLGVVVGGHRRECVVPASVIYAAIMSGVTGSQGCIMEKAEGMHLL